MKFKELNAEYKFAATIMGVIGISVLTGALTLATAAAVKEAQSYHKAIEQEAQHWRGIERKDKLDIKTQVKLNKVTDACASVAFSVRVLGQGRDEGVSRRYMVDAAYVASYRHLSDMGTEIAIASAEEAINYVYNHGGVSEGDLEVRTMIDCYDNFSTSYTFNATGDMSSESGLDLLRRMNE